MVESEDLSAIKRAHGVPDTLEGCHTTLIDGYVIEGHMFIDIIERLLAERPAIKGISLPGMPARSPGVDGEKAGLSSSTRTERSPAKVYATA